MNEFEEFARAFRERTQKRLMEFEDTLNKAQGEVEQSVLTQTHRQRPRPHSPQPGYDKAPRAAGQVKGILKRG